MEIKNKISIGVLALGISTVGLNDTIVNNMVQ